MAVKLVDNMSAAGYSQNMLFKPRVLLVELTSSPSGIRVAARFNVEDGTVYASSNRKDLIGHVQSVVHDLLEKHLVDSRFVDALKNLSTDLISPLASMLEHADTISVAVNRDSVYFPFDLLLYQNVPLFLRRPVFYTFEQHELEQQEDLKIDSALIISDVTADPQQACADVAKQLLGVAKKVIYADVAHARPSLFKRKAIDLLLMSVHGKVFTDERSDKVALYDWEPFASQLATVTPKIAYFDSCKIGVSLDFLSQFQSDGTIFFLGSVLSNEAGNSSTITMKEFFRYLNTGIRPVEALFLTRRLLFERFKDDDFSRRLWRAFAFRLYLLN